MQLTSTLQLITFWIFVAAMSGSIVGAPRSCAWRSLSSCCLNQNIKGQLIFINQMSWHLRGGFSHLVFPGQIKIWIVDFWGRLRTAEVSEKPLGVRTRNNNKLYQPACSVILGLGIEPWPVESNLTEEDLVVTNVTQCRYMIV